MTKISQLPAGTTLTGTELVPVVQSGITVEVPSSYYWNFPVYAYASLPSSPVQGQRAFINNGSQTLAANIGATLSASTGSNFLPVFWSGSAWIVG